uniref:Essential meiotic structure-specific endonuclease 1 n=1 Tax=Stegastes partitus TaxID=144197 RepID=A0A3B5BJ47_9TELE
MTCQSTLGNMGTYSETTTDLDEDFPVFDFLQTSPKHADKPDIADMDDSDAEVIAISSPRKTDAGACRGKVDVMMITSDSDDDDAPYVPLAQRLKQRSGTVISASSAAINGKDAEHYSPPSSQLFRQNGFSNCVALGASPAKKKFAEPMVEEIQASREEALRRKQARKRQQPDKEALRQEQEKQKAERNAAKALRPEECIKHMVVCVDPAILQLEGGGALLASVQALGCSCAIEKQPLAHSVSWMRRAPCAQPGEAECVPEAHVVIQMTADDFVSLIHSYVQRHGSSHHGLTLTSWVQDQQRRNPGKTLSLVVIELEKFFRSQKSQNQKRFREAVMCEETRGGKVKRKRKNDGAEVSSEVSRVEVEEVS